MTSGGPDFNLTTEAVETIIAAALIGGLQARNIVPRLRPPNLDVDALRRDLLAARVRWQISTELDDPVLWGERIEHLSEIVRRARQLRLALESEHGAWAVNRLAGHFPIGRGVRLVQGEPITIGGKLRPNLQAEEEECASPREMLTALVRIESTFAAEAKRLDPKAPPTERGACDNERLAWVVESAAPVRTTVPPLQSFVAEHLAEIYNRHFGSGGGKRSGAYISFATAALAELGISNKGQPYPEGSIESSLRDFSTKRNRRGNTVGKSRAK